MDLSSVEVLAEGDLSFLALSWPDESRTAPAEEAIAVPLMRRTAPEGLLLCIPCGFIALSTRRGRKRRCRCCYWPFDPGEASLCCVGRARCWIGGLGDDCGFRSSRPAPAEGGGQRFCNRGGFSCHLSSARSHPCIRGSACCSKGMATTGPSGQDGLLFRPGKAGDFGTAAKVVSTRHGRRAKSCRQPASAKAATPVPQEAKKQCQVKFCSRPPPGLGVRDGAFGLPPKSHSASRPVCALLRGLAAFCKPSSGPGRLFR